MSDAAAAARDKVSAVAHDVRDGVAEAGEAVSEAGSRLRGNVRVYRREAGVEADRYESAAGDYAKGYADAARGYASRARDYAATARESVSGVGEWAADTGQSAWRRAESAGDTVRGEFSRILDEQPLVVAALGIAVGAALGAALPGTDTEDRLLGERADAVKQQAADLAREQYEHAKDVVGSTVDSVKREAESQGLTADSVAGVARNLGDKATGFVGDIARDLGDKASDSVRDLGGRVKAVADAATETVKSETGLADDKKPEPPKPTAHGTSTASTSTAGASPSAGMPSTSGSSTSGATSTPSTKNPLI